MKEVFNSSNIPRTSVNEFVKRVSAAYSFNINNDVGVSKLPSIMLWGPPGTGKSDAVRELGDAISINTGKAVKVTDVRLLLSNPIDLRGIPVANAEKTLSVWLKPKIFDLDTSTDVINILFLDELSACSATMQAAAYQITLDRIIGEHKLPDNCIVIAAGNRLTDKSVAFKMPKALANRLCHIEINPNFDSWMDWAKKNNIHYKIIDFLVSRRDFFMAFDPQKDDLAFPTPRTWELASKVLKAYDGDVEEAYMMIAGCVGNSTAIEFLSWCKVYNEIPSLEAIFSGKNPSVPKKPNIVYALVSSMVAYARDCKDDLEKISNAIAYSEKFAPDFSVTFMREVLSFEPGYSKKLITLPAYRKWVEQRGGFLNGIN